MNASKIVYARETIEKNGSNIIEQIVSKTVGVSKTIEQNAIKNIKAGTAKGFLTCLDNLLVESIRITTLLKKSITRNWMTGTEQPAQILYPTT